MWGGPERGERIGQGKTQIRGSLAVKLRKASTEGNAGSWTVFCVEGRPGCGQEVLPGKYRINDNLPKEGTRIF